MFESDRRQIDQLKVDVLVRHHAGLRILGRIRIGPDVRARSRQPRMERGFPRVRRPDQRDLCRTFRPDHQRRSAVPSALPGAFQFVGEILDTRFDIRLQMLGALMLRDHAQHLAQAFEPLPRVAGLAEGRLGRLVFG